MSADPLIDPATASAVEAAHWAPPVAPMEMPRQVLEAPRHEGVVGWVLRLFRPLQPG